MSEPSARVSRPCRRPNIHYRDVWWISTLLGIWLAATSARSASDLMRSGDYAGALPVLRQEVAKHPTDAVLRRALGLAMLESGDAAGAVEALAEARRLAPKDPSTLFLLGRAAEQTGRDDLALDAYRGYLARGGRERNEVEARLRTLSLKTMQASARKALASERSLQADTLPPNTIAVPEFSVTAASDTLRPLSRGLALVMTTDLSQVPQLRVLERQRLNVLFDEMARVRDGKRTPGPPAAPPTAVVSRSSARRIGALVGARRFAQGGLLPIERTRIQLDAVVLDARDGSTRAAGPAVKGDLNEVLALEKGLVFQVIDSLGIQLTSRVRRAIGVPPTRSFAAFLAFSHAIEFEERGQIENARAAYREALRLDPSFSMARERNEVLSVSPAQQAALDRTISRRATTPSDMDDRLAQSSQQIGLRPGPAPHDPTPSEVVRAASLDFRVTVRIR